MFWFLFNTFVVVLLVLDLFFFHRRDREVTVKEAVAWSAFWIGLALAFNVLVYFWQGPHKAMEFLTGYLLEESLSVDNLFVFLMIFSYFRVEQRYQHKILFWGILGALVFRVCFILGGIALLERFEWIIYLFGAFLVFTGLRMVFKSDEDVHPEHNPLLKAVRRVLPVTTQPHHGRFFVRENGRLMATSLFVVLLVIETTDILFAADSIPAILSVSQDRFIVYTSNVFAILGLRTLFFALAGFMGMFRFLNYGLAGVLVFVGIKIAISGFYHMPIALALGVVAALLTISVLASVFIKDDGGPKAK